MNSIQLSVLGSVSLQKLRIKIRKEMKTNLITVTRETDDPHITHTEKQHKPTSNIRRTHTRPLTHRKSLKYTLTLLFHCTHTPQQSVRTNINRLASKFKLLMKTTVLIFRLAKIYFLCSFLFYFVHMFGYRHNSTG